MSTSMHEGSTVGANERHEPTTVAHQASTVGDEHPAWCQAPCDAESAPAGDRKHWAWGQEVPLSMYDKWTDENGGDHLPSVAITVRQHVRDAEPTHGHLL